MRSRILLAKTGLDGHWRGIAAVATALRDGGFEVVLLGMATSEVIVATAIEEGVDLVGLSVGGHMAVVERTIAALREAAPEVPIVVGGTLRPAALKRLDELGIRGFPPGSRLYDIVEHAKSLVSAPEDKRGRPDLVVADNFTCQSHFEG